MANKKKQKKKVGTTHVAIILDRSGSMDAVRDETIAGFNEQVGTIKKKAKEQGRLKNTFVTLTLFNDAVKFKKFACPVGDLTKIDRRHYRPDCTTAMLDGVGMTLEKYDKEVEDGVNVNYLVVVISDGLENDSKEYDWKQVAEMIQKRRKTGRWTFSYMGANQDLSELSEVLHIPKSNIARYAATRSGTAATFVGLSSSVACYMDTSARGERVSEKFFSEGDEIAEFGDGDDEDGGKKGGGGLLH